MWQEKINICIFIFRVVNMGVWIEDKFLIFSTQNADLTRFF